MSLSAAKSRLMFARENLESGRTDGIESMLEAAEGFLAGEPDAEAAPYRAELAAIRADLAARPSSEDELAVRGARYKLKQVADWIGMNFAAEDIESGIRAAEDFLVNVPDVHKAAVLQEIAMLRAGRTPAAVAPVLSVSVPVPVSAAADALTEDEQNVIRRVRTALMWARDGHDESKVEEAERLLAEVREEHRAPYLPEVAEIRTLIAESRRAEEIRRVTQFVDARFGPAERGEADSIAYCFGRLGSEELRSVLPPEMMARYRARLDAAVKGRVAGLRANALERAEPHLRAIEAHLVPGLFVGLGESETFGIVGDCENLKSRAEHELWAATTLDSAEVWGEERDPVPAEDRRALNARLVVPLDDPALSVIRERLATADATIADALAVWHQARLDAEVAERWSMTRREFDGWREETTDLSLTHLAIIRTRSLLDEPKMLAIRREIEHELQAALTKAATTFNRALDDLERAALPLGESGLDKLAATQASVASTLIGDAERSLAGSVYLEPYAARVRGLNERWQADIAAAMSARQALYDRLSAEADASWPRIVAATGATTDFDPLVSGAGRVVLLHQVYNRAGWEFNGCDFALRWDGTPVGGGYTDDVRAALEHAWYELKLDVDDRIRWDVIGVVEGPGKIGERTVRVLRDAATNRELGTIEEWPPVECTWLRIIALHAGPVAVGPLLGSFGQ